MISESFSCVKKMRLSVGSNFFQSKNLSASTTGFNVFALVVATLHLARGCLLISFHDDSNLWEFLLNWSHFCFVSFGWVPQPPFSVIRRFERRWYLMTLLNLQKLKKEKNSADWQWRLIVFDSFEGNALKNSQS